MKKLLKTIFLFFLFTILVYVVLIFIWGKMDNYYLNKNLKYRRGSHGYLYTRLKDADTTKNIDILFLGSSHSYRGYDPRNFGMLNYRAFNLGSSAQTPLQTNILLKKYLGQFNPKLVVIDVYPTLFANDGVEAGLDLISNMDPNSDILAMSLDLNNIKVYNTLIYSYILKTFRLNKEFNEGETKGSDKYIKGGFVETNRTESVDSTPLVRIVANISQGQSDAFKQIINSLKARNIQYILVQAPVTKRAYNQIANNEEIDQFISSHGTYYNFNKQQILPDQFFYDDDHLNQAGVNVFNGLLIEQLKKEGKLP